MTAYRTRLLAGALALGIIAAAVPAAHAQSPAPSGPARSFTRHIDGRIAFLKAELKITPAQQAAFDNYVKALRQNADEIDRKSTRLNSSHVSESRMPSSA